MLLEELRRPADRRTGLSAPRAGRMLGVCWTLAPSLSDVASIRLGSTSSWPGSLRKGRLHCCDNRNVAVRTEIETVDSCLFSESHAPTVTDNAKHLKLDGLQPEGR